MRDPDAVFRQLQTVARNTVRGQTQIVLDLYVHERFLARLIKSRYRQKFVLKGGLLLATMDVRRATRDADVLAVGLPGEEEKMKKIIAEIALIDLDDGLSFDAAAITATYIRDDAEYQALRLAMPAALGTAKLKLKLDVNFGDPVDPEPIILPALLEDEPDLRLQGYKIETVISEKGETMIARGDANTRDRDYGDVYLLSRRHSFNQGDLHDELARVAKHRQRSLEPLARVLITLAADRQRPWEAFRRRVQLEDALPESFAEVVGAVTSFLDPAIEGNAPRADWDPRTASWKLG